MRYSYLPFLMALTVTAGTAAVGAAEVTVNQPDIVAQDLQKVRESGRVGAALWTRRTDSYTLQLVYGVEGLRDGRITGIRIANLRDIDPSLGRRTPAAQPVGLQAPQPVTPPQFQVWLLRTNGTQILPHHRSPPPDPAKCTVRCIVQEVEYRFSLADGDEAVAAVVRVDDDYYVEKLRSLKPGP